MCKSVLFCANGFATGFAKKFMATLKPFLDLRVQRKKDELYPLKISVSATRSIVFQICENLPCSGELEFPDVPNRQTQIEKAI